MSELLSLKEVVMLSVVRCILRKVQVISERAPLNGHRELEQPLPFVVYKLRLGSIKRMKYTFRNLCLPIAEALFTSMA